MLVGCSTKSGWLEWTMMIIIIITTTCILCHDAGAVKRTGANKGSVAADVRGEGGHSATRQEESRRAERKLAVGDHRDSYHGAGVSIDIVNLSHTYIDTPASTSTKGTDRKRASIDIH
jgi:hypothetical protein